MGYLALVIVFGGVIVLLAKYRAFRIVSGIVVGLGILAAITAWLLLAYIPNRPHKIDEAQGIRLGWDRSEVVFRKGNPDAEHESGGDLVLEWQGPVYAYFNNDSVVAVMVDSDSDGDWPPFRLAPKQSVDDVEKKMGRPTVVVSNSENPESRLWLYYEYQMVFLMRKGRISSWGIATAEWMNRSR